MCSRETLENVLKEVMQAYKNVYGNKLVKVVLYGSYARGDYDEESDINIAGIVKDKRSNIQKLAKILLKIINDINLKYDVLVSCISIPYDEFIEYRNYLPFYKNIRKEGFPINV